LDREEGAAFIHGAYVRVARDEYAEARKDYDEAVRLNPNRTTAYAARALFVMWCPDEKYQDAPQAFWDAKRVCELTEWNNPKALEIYAAALAGLGDFDGAVKWQKKAMEDPDYLNAAPGARNRLK